jgi:hypothetical protein
MSPTPSPEDGKEPSFWNAEAHDENSQLNSNDELKNMLASMLTVIHQGNKELQDGS